MRTMYAKGMSIMGLIALGTEVVQKAKRPTKSFLAGVPMYVFDYPRRRN